MEKLLITDCKISGEIFYITDDHPTNMEFIFGPLRAFLSDRENGSNKFAKGVQYSNSSNFGFQVPKFMAVAYSTILSFVSMMFGKSFQMPLWGLTYMELQKVILI